MSGNLGKLYKPGETIVRQGETGNCMFAIQSGRVAVIKERSGSEVTVAELVEGDIFGEMSIFEHEVRSATVRALEDAMVMTIDQRTFLRRIEDDPSIAFNLVRMMSGRIRRLSSELAAIKFDGDKASVSSF